MCGHIFDFFDSLIKALGPMYSTDVPWLEQTENDRSELVMQLATVEDPQGFCTGKYLSLSFDFKSNL